MRYYRRAIHWVIQAILKSLTCNSVSTECHSGQWDCPGKFCLTLKDIYMCVLPSTRSIRASVL